MSKKRRLFFELCRFRRDARFLIPFVILAQLQFLSRRELTFVSRWDDFLGKRVFHNGVSTGEEKFLLWIFPIKCRSPLFCLFMLCYHCFCFAVESDWLLSSKTISNLKRGLYFFVFFTRLWQCVAFLGLLLRLSNCKLTVLLVHVIWILYRTSWKGH